MALNYHILENKKTIKLPSRKDGMEQECIDLLSDSFNKNQVDIMHSIYVLKEYVARPDLISLAIYGTDEYADIICKINGISNPFELNEGDMIYIPLVTNIKTYIGGDSEVTDGIYTDEETILKRIASYQKLRNERRNPSELTIGTLNFVIDKIHNLIYY